MALSKPLLVVAIDIGTTYSGYAFSFQHEFLADKLKITTNKVWSDGDNHLQTSYKTPTSVLIDPDGHFHSFGYEAETKYPQLPKNKEEKDWLLFRRFKMILYKSEISETMKLESVSGQRFNALSVFAMSVQYLKEHFSRSLQQQVADSEIQYVLTVPAMWDENAKQFMRKAALQSGMPGDQLTIALEPEAASIFCQALLANGRSDDKFCGTVDTTVHEVMSSGHLKELHKASGGGWGGTQVDDQFTDLLVKIFTVKAMKEFGKHHKSDWLELEKEFEINKRRISSNDEQKFSFRLPASLHETFSFQSKCSLEDQVAESGLSRDVRAALKLTTSSPICCDKMRISGKAMQGLMKPTIHNIITHVETLMADPKCRGISHILLVGGFSESPLLQEEFRKTFRSVTVVTPLDAVLSVMKGAVIFGHQPGAIGIRLAAFTYGIRSLSTFVDGEHDPDKLIMIEGERMCEGIFNRFVSVDEEVPYGMETNEHTFNPILFNLILF
ncbi:heat shock 70 kDa protein 12A-like [Liolophura sinensis]|uniref:heat shock 70 kDa protein 12A-like n=1 Tax=Liolophura sinensis TaxID=3198878 RepID=UPI0031588E08